MPWSDFQYQGGLPAVTYSRGGGDPRIGSASAVIPESKAVIVTKSSTGRTVAPHYLSLLLRGDQSGATRLIRTLLDGGTPIVDIYLNVFQPALRETGQLWASNKISVADEHYVSAATQLIMAQIYPKIPSKKRLGRKALLACVEGELHDIGLRMVADMFEMSGWDGLFLGAGAPIESIPSFIDKHHPDILLFSAATEAHLPAARETIVQLRRRPPKDTPPIMVGGHVFNQQAALWRQVGADAHARRTEDVVAAAEKLRIIKMSKP